MRIRFKGVTLAPAGFILNIERRKIMATEITYKLIHWPKEQTGEIWFVIHRDQHGFTPIIKTPHTNMVKAQEWLRATLHKQSVV